MLPGARRDKYPLTRRAMIETSLYNLAYRYQDQGMHAIERKNEGKNYSHVEITCGRLVIIPAAVETQGDLVRKAVYRFQLAKDPQAAFDLMGIEQDCEPAIPPDALLAVILYGPRSSYPQEQHDATPDFVVVRFPMRGFGRYAEGRLDLLKGLTDYERDRQEPRKPVPLINPDADERDA